MLHYDAQADAAKERVTAAAWSCFSVLFIPKETQAPGNLFVYEQQFRLICIVRSK